MSSTTIPTAPLPVPAVEALARLERAFVPMPLHIVRAATRYDIVRARIAELEAMDARRMTAAQFDDLLDAQNELAMRRKQLAEAGRLDLIEAAR
ncbi:MAG: hypothetical protein HOY69_22210 [Streptomyces sp.]|nr:hypothetical protein [Streptomyces sp.]